jgi:hypothetical protein
MIQMQCIMHVSGGGARHRDNRARARDLKVQINFVMLNKLVSTAETIRKDRLRSLSHRRMKAYFPAILTVVLARPAVVVVVSVTKPGILPNEAQPLPHHLNLTSGQQMFDDVALQPT